MDKIFSYFKINKILLLTIIFFLNNFAVAASLYISPSTKNVKVGDSFSLIVFVNSDDQAINAISGEINWSANMLKLVNFSKSQSIINFWVKEPEFLDNQINFEGVVFNPGYIGTNGKILTLNFRALKEGTAKVNFFSGMVLANDGQGTNLLSKMNGSNIIIAKQDEVEEVKDTIEEKISKTETVSVINLSKPEIFSSSHPDQEKWYNNNNPIFEWQVPRGVNKVRTGYGNDPYLVPQISHSPPINKLQLNNISDGSYYFAVQFIAGNNLSEITRFKFKIDTKPPQFEEFFLDTTDQNLLILNLKLKDELSGIDTLNIYLDNQLVRKISEVNYYKEIFKNIKPGEHVIKIEVFDKAGNYNEKIKKTFISKHSQIVIEKKYTIYLILILLILIFGILILWFYILRRKLEDVHKDITSQRLKQIKKDFHNYFTEFLQQVRDDLNSLDNDQKLSNQEKEVYRRIREVIIETEIKIKDILDKLK